jgi:hypothetical protein
VKKGKVEDDDDEDDDDDDDDDDEEEAPKKKKGSVKKGKVEDDDDDDNVTLESLGTVPDWFMMYALTGEDKKKFDKKIADMGKRGKPLSEFINSNYLERLGTATSKCWKGMKMDAAASKYKVSKKDIQLCVKFAKSNDLEF